MSAMDDPPRGIDLLDAPGHLLRRCHQRSHEIFNDLTDGFDLTRQQFALLHVLTQHPGASVQELANRTGIDRNTLSGIVQRLREKGRVTVQRSAVDARAQQLAITAEGIALVEAIEPAIHRVSDAILAPLAPDERAELMRLMRKMIGAAG